jgi:hypothetical protein
MSQNQLDLLIGWLTICQTLNGPQIGSDISSVPARLTDYMYVYIILSVHTTL